MDMNYDSFVWPKQNPNSKSEIHPHHEAVFLHWITLLNLYERINQNECKQKKNNAVFLNLPVLRTKQYL